MKSKRVAISRVMPASALSTSARSRRETMSKLAMTAPLDRLAMRRLLIARFGCSHRQRAERSWSASGSPSPRCPAPPPSSPTRRRAISSPAIPARLDFAATAARYGLVHAASLVALALLLRTVPAGAARVWLLAAGWCFAAAVALFCGTLDLLACGAAAAVHAARSGGRHALHRRLGGAVLRARVSRAAG